MNSKKRASRDASARPGAEDVRHQTSGVADVSRKAGTDAASRDRQAQQFFERVSQDREQSLQFLRKAGILDSSGKLAKPYRD